MESGRRNFGFLFAIESATILALVVVFGCSPDSPKLVPPLDQKVERVTGESAIFNAKVDILLVVASDSSMSEHDRNLRANAALFTSEIFKNQFIDYHIGVINAMQTDQGLGIPWGGRLNGTTKFVDKTTTAPDQLLIQNLNVGSSANDPVALFSVARSALSGPISTNENAGFLRPDAALAVMFISDTDPEDSAEPGAADFYAFLLNLKSGDRRRVFVYAAYDPSPTLSCNGEGPAVMLTGLLELAKPFSFGFSLCDADFGKKLGSVSDNIVSNVGRTMYLSRPPAIGSIKVSYGTQILPNDAATGWIFDPGRNAILFGNDIQLDPNQPKGTTVKVDFNAAQFE